MPRRAAVPAKYRTHWRRPWTRRAKYSPGFRRWLASQGLLSPHFSLQEARSRRSGTPVPRYLRARARNHAFNLERLRHELGDRPVRLISWYRTPADNRAAGGKRFSRHLFADATDHSRQWVQSVGRVRLLRAADRIFRKGGVGTYPSGSVHFDSRGFRARW